MDIVSLIFKANTSDLDKAEKKLDGVQKSAEGAAKSAKGMTSALEGAKSVGGPIGDVANRLEDMKSRADGAMSAVRGLGSASVVAVAALVALAGAAGILAAIRFAGVLDDIGDMAQKLGLSATQAALLDQQMKAAGTSVDTYYAGLQKVSNALSKAGDEGKAASEALATLNVNVKDGATPQETMNSLAEKYGEKLREGSVSVDEMAALQVVLGKNYRETIVAVEQAAIAQERLNTFQAAGIGISQDGTKAAGDFESAQNDVAFVLQAVGSKLVAEVVPAFTGFINALVDSYKNGGLVKVALDSIRVAAQLVMVPIRALFNIFIQLDAAVQSVGKSIGALFAAIATRSTSPFDSLKQDLAEIWATANSRTTGMWSSDSGAVEGPKATTVTPSSGGGGGSKGKAEKPRFAGDADGAFKEYLRMKDEEAKRSLEDMKRYDAAESAAEREYQSLLKRIQGYKDLADPTAVYRREFEQLTADYELGQVPLDAYIAKSKELGDQMAKVNDTTKKGSDEFDIMQRVGMTAFSGLEQQLVSLATTGKMSFKSFAQAILADIAKMIIQLMIIKPLMAALGFGGVAKSANGNVFDGGLKKSAKGNVFDGPTLHGYSGGIGMLGEAGPEAVMPLKRGANGKLGVVSAGGAAGATQQNITIQVNVEGGKDSQETGNAVAAKVQELFVRGIVRQELKTATRQKAYAV